MAKTLVSVKNVHKTFSLPNERDISLKRAILNRTKGIRPTYTEQKVLDGISFTISKGDFFGIVGRNGSGKSTLLKLLAGIYVPDSGDIKVRGDLTPFIELGVGFNSELTAKENVYLNGAMFGFSRAHMDNIYDEIVDFAELRGFMGQKLKNYSSGMRVRLAFAVSIHAKNDIMLFDEVLAVGDAAFQLKCVKYFESIIGKQTIVFVTHDMDSVRRFCNKAILLENGKIIKRGNPGDVADKYGELLYGS